MSVFRRHKKTNYTSIDNGLFLDKSLSMKAKGLLAQILSLPDEWHYSISGLTSLFSDGRDAVNSAINELVEHGYIVRTQVFDDNGKFAGYDYDIYENPQENTGAVAGFPFTEKPFTEKPFTENQALLNTNRLNTNISNTNNIDISPISPYDDYYEQFWAAYPKKVDKKGCYKKFCKIKDLNVIFPDIMRALETQKRSKQWNEENGKYIPHPSTWINQERWNNVNEIEVQQTTIDEIAKQNIDGFLL